VHNETDEEVRNANRNREVSHRHNKKIRELKEHTRRLESILFGVIDTIGVEELDRVPWKKVGIKKKSVVNWYKKKKVP